MQRDMASNQDTPKQSYPAYVNEASYGNHIGDYLTAVGTPTYLKHPSPPNVNDQPLSSSHPVTNFRETERYVDPKHAPGNGVSMTSELGIQDGEMTDHEYMELDDSLPSNSKRQMPDVKDDPKTRNTTEDIRQGSSSTDVAKSKRVVRILVVFIVFLILAIAAVGGYAGWKLSQGDKACSHTHECSSTAPARPQTICISELGKCSSACSEDTCSSCCSTAAGAPVMLVSVDERTILAPVTTDNWVVLMKRESGYVDFTSPNWQSYKDGFGNLKGEFWLGNEIMHKLTTNGSQWRLRVDMKAYSGECRYAEYNNFWIGPETDFYQMHISNYSGNAGDSLTATEKPWYNHDGVYFSTYDADHDHLNDTNCAEQWLGGWWYNSCFYAKFTGLYGHFIGLAWEDWLGEDIYLKYADMKISVV